MPDISRRQIFAILPYVLIVAGMILSVASMAGICTSACSEAHKYRFYDIDFGWAGICTFGLLAVLRYFRHNRFLQIGYIWVLACACGGEAWFIFVQKAVIKSWCPTCVSIAAVVGLLAMVVLLEYFSEQTIKEINMRKFIPALIMKSLLIVVGTVFGFAVAFLGVEKPAEAQADTDLWLGKADSAVEVYVVTDWFCPGCIKAEPEIETAVRAISKQARIAFIDYAIHPESTNFSPYNLSFQIYNKAQYLPLRAALVGLSQRTKTPTTEDVQAAIKSTGIKYKQLPMSDVMAGLNAYTAVIRNSGVTSTPTVIVRSVKTGKIVKKLVGYKEITAKGIYAAVVDAGKN